MIIFYKFYIITTLIFLSEPNTYRYFYSKIFNIKKPLIKYFATLSLEPQAL